MAHNPPKDQENQVTHDEIEPHSDIKKVRGSALVPDKSGNVSIERREESLLPPKRKRNAKETEKGKSD